MELITNNKICATCAHCAENESGGLDCRAKPPIALPMQRPNAISGQTEVQLATVFPPVGPNLWCGEHRMKQ